ncbi:MAG TPA: barstar family protein [Burkholderiales bacterium]|jgi:hypothetical protein|nr:barstar family protein [Burkholderiales bacterium]
MTASTSLQPEQSGVFLISRAVATMRRALQDTRHAWLKVNLQGVHDKAGFLAACASDLDFPAHFGGNWDAFADALNDFSWMPADAYVLVFEQTDEFALEAPDDYATALEILRAAADAWRARNRPFVVVLDYAPPGAGVKHLPEAPVT